MQCFEAALRRAGAEHPPGLDFMGKSLERDGAETTVLEDASGQASRAGADYHAAGGCQLLQARRETRRLTDDIALHRGARLRQIAHYHEPSGDADAQVDPSGRLPRQTADDLDQGEPGMHRAL